MIRLFTVVVLLVTACTAAPPPPPVSLVDNRTPMRRIADSTRILVRLGVDETDTGSVHAQLAAAERSAERAREYVTGARQSAAMATESFHQAIEKGDRLQVLVTSVVSPDDRPSRYARFWTTSRTRLESARSRSDLAKQAADSALGCAAMPCSSAMANVLRNHMMAAAGEAHEAQSLVRIAMTYIP